MGEPYTPVYEEKLIEKMFAQLWGELCAYRDKYEKLEAYERNRGHSGGLAGQHQGDDS